MRDKTEITLEENGETLKFQIEKMSAFSALMWKKRALSAVDIKKIAAEIQKETVSEEQAESFGLRVISDIFQMNDNAFQSLLEDLIGCCYIIRENVPVRLNKNNIDGFFYDSDTLFKLCFESFKFNGFFPKAAFDALQNFRAPADIKRKG